MITDDEARALDARWERALEAMPAAASQLRTQIRAACAERDYALAMRLHESWSPPPPAPSPEPATLRTVLTARREGSRYAP